VWTGGQYKILPGIYDIKVEHKLRRGSIVKWLREVRVPAGTNLTLRAEGIAFSRLKILAYDSDGKKLSSLRVSCYKSGDRTTVLYPLWTGTEYKILPGTYDIKIERKTAEGVVSKWIEKVTIEAGDRMQKKVSL